MKGYKYFVGTKEVVCEYVWRGVKFYGKAKCHPSDTFDVEKGKKLALARALLKVAQTRKKMAQIDCENFGYAMEVYKMSYMDALDWLDEADQKLKTAEATVNALTSEL